MKLYKGPYLCPVCDNPRMGSSNGPLCNCTNLTPGAFKESDFMEVPDMSDGFRDSLKDINLHSSFEVSEPLKEGTKYDADKVRMDLLPSDPLEEIAKVLTFGAKKYKAHNWRKGINYSRVYAGLQRHLKDWNNNISEDSETKLNHLAHAGCCIMFLLEYEMNKEKYAKFDDRYKGEE